MLQIDNRLLEAECEMGITENFNRILALIDGLNQRVEVLETPQESEAPNNG